MTEHDRVVLLGAGASAEAGVPMSFEMTRELVTRLKNRSIPPEAAKALNFVCGELIAYDASKGADPYTGLDVERVFAAVELLARRRDLEVTPFVSTWHPAVDVWDRPELPHGFDQSIRRGVLSDSALSTHSRDAVVALVRELLAGGNGEVYRALMRQMIEHLVELVSTTEKEVGYLAPLVTAGTSGTGITIATLNYDLAIERAGEAVGVPVHTGIERWAEHGIWDWPVRGVRLLKLHGSIDWTWERSPWAPGQMGHAFVRQADAPLTGAFSDPALVFGHGGKLRADGPFLALLAEFEAQLARTTELVVIGYSFRDPHVNEVLRRWITEDVSRRFVVIDPHLPRLPASHQPETFRDEMLHTLIPEGWTAHTLTPTDADKPRFEPRLTAIRQDASVGISLVFDTSH